MSKIEFQSDLGNLQLGFLASKWILERTPFLFGDDALAFIKWKEVLAAEVDVDSRSMIVTGSASCGFSLSLEKKYSDFAITSDVDVALVSPSHFDIAWRALRNLGTKRYDLTPRQRLDIEDHMNRLIFYGTIATDKILPLLPFATTWVKALSSASRVAPVDGRSVKARIYRDFESLREYQIMGLKKLRQAVR
jgi:hypothetical protein